MLERYQRKATMIVNYAERTEQYRPLIQAHFDVVLEAVAAGHHELVRLHRADETLHELKRNLDLEELSAIAAKS